MDPPARESVKRINAQLWTLGTKVMCIKVDAEETPPFDSLCSWQETDKTFHLLPFNDTLLPPSAKGDAAIDRIQECGTGGSVWGLGNEAICKVKGWREDRQLEAATIAFVSEHCPSVPLPQVLYSWIDEASNRTFLVMRRVHCRTLNSAWAHLSATQRLNIASEVAQHCATLALNTSLRYETVSHRGVLEYWLMGRPPASNPTWLPMVLGPFTAPEFRAYMAQISSEAVPKFGDSLLLYHPDLGPTNILVSDDGDKVAAIIDWEAAAYFPDFWVATRLATNWAYRLSDLDTDADKNEWSKLFVKALKGEGFDSLDTAYTKWNTAKIGSA
jgi:hypothetical protein